MAQALTYNQELHFNPGTVFEEISRAG